MGPKKEKTEEKDGKGAVLKYLTNQNRPYSVNDLVANLRGEIPKKMMEKALDGLVADGKVKEKLNGKQKAYVVNQDEFPVASEAELDKYDQEANEVQNELNELNAEIKVKEDKIKFQNSQLTTAEAKKRLKEVQDEIAQLEVKLSELGDQKNMVDQDTMNAAKKSQTENVKEWRKRKRMFSNMADAVLENFPHPKKMLFEEMGVETDQDAGVTMPVI